MRKLKLFTLLAGLMLFASQMFADVYPHVVSNGNCGAQGDNLTYEIWLAENGDQWLVISGSGAMEDFLSSGGPWRSSRQDLKSVTFNTTGLTHIGNYAFDEFWAITSIEIPEGVISLGTGCLHLCTNLTSITLPSTLQTIGSQAFASTNTAKLKSITIPEGVTSIGDYCFRDCKALETISLPSTLVSIGMHAFEYCNNLQSLTIPANVTSIGQGLTVGCTGLMELSVAPGNTKYDSRSNCRAIIETAENKLIAGCNHSYISYIEPAVTKIANEAFVGLSFSATQWVPENVTALYGGGAFNNCTGIDNLIIPEGLTNMEAGEFSGCEISTIEVSMSNTKYDSRDNCNAIIETATNKLLRGSLNTVIPDDVTEILSSAFSGLTHLTSITIPENVASIGNLAFKKCSGLTEIICRATTPPTVETEQYSHSFYQVDRSIPVYVPDESIVTYQNTSGWSEFTNLQPLSNLPATSGIIGDLTWEYNETTHELSISGYGSMPEDWESNLDAPWHAHLGDITAVVIGSGVTSIAPYAFDGFEHLASVTFETPSSLQKIGRYAFEGCTSLEEITLPETLNELGDYAFYGCSNMTRINFTSSTIPYMTGDFAMGDYIDYPNLKITYPDGADDSYVNNNLLRACQFWWDHLYNASTMEHAPKPHASGSLNATVNWEFYMNVKPNGDQYRLSDLEGTLAITGTGSMPDFAAYYECPWNHMAPETSYDVLIHYVNVAEGIDKIGANAFSMLPMAKSVYIPSTVTFIGENAFYATMASDVYLLADPTVLTWNDGGFDDFQPMTKQLTWNDCIIEGTHCYVSASKLATCKSKWATGNDETDVRVVFVPSGLSDMSTAEEIQEIISIDFLHVDVATIVRPVPRDGYFFTLCLPFNLNATQIANSSLATAEIMQLSNAWIDGDIFKVSFKPVSPSVGIKVGEPYLIRYETATALDKLDFVNVSIRNIDPIPVTKGNITMVGTYLPKYVEAQTSATSGEAIMFLKTENTLTWPNVGGNIKPFRCYFKVNTSGAHAPRRGMPTRLVIEEDTNSATGIDNAQFEEIQNGKMIEDGQLVIIRNGQKYNAAGQIVK